MKRRTEITKKIQYAGLSPYLTSVIVLLASACDFVTIKSVMEFYLTEAVVIQVVITGAVAFILNYLPSLLGKTGLSTLFQTNFFRLFFRYCTGV